MNFFVILPLFFASFLRIAPALAFSGSLGLTDDLAKTSVPIFRFHEVATGIYRGARPNAAGLQALAQLGVKVDIDLENDSAAIRREALEAERLGMKFISKPMSGFWAPHDWQVKEILALLAGPHEAPIFVHCQHGQDRTGVIIGLYRVFEERWAPQAAYSEMRAIGFHPSLFLLNHYFEKKTGFED